MAFFSFYVPIFAICKLYLLFKHCQELSAFAKTHPLSLFNLHKKTAKISTLWKFAFFLAFRKKYAIFGAFAAVFLKKYPLQLQGVLSLNWFSCQIRQAFRRQLRCGACSLHGRQPS